MMQDEDGRRRVVIECVTPEVDGGRFAAKRIVGDRVVVEADIFTDGHDLIAGRLLHRREQETQWAAAPLEPRSTRSEPREFDRHAGVGETSNSLYLTPNLVDMRDARTAPLTLPPHLQKMLPDVVAGDPTASRVFLAEALKAAETGKGTSTRDMTDTGVWSARDVKAATADRGREDTERFVNAAVAFIERWKQLRPMGAK